MFFAVIFILTTIGFVNFKSASDDNYSTILGTQAFLISKAVEQKTNRYFDVLNAVSQSIPVDQNGPIDMEQAITALHNIRDDMEVLNAYVGFENGNTYSANKNGIIPDFNAKELNREWYERIFSGEKKIITTPYRSASNNLVMALGVPVTRNGQVVATLCMNLPLDKITNFISELTENNQVYGSRGDGFVFASKIPSDIGENLFSINPSFKQYANTPSSEHYYAFDGADLFVSGVQNAELGWNFWVWDTVEQINSKSNENLLFSSITAIVLIILSLGISYILIIRLMYVPIGGEPKDIEGLIEKISQGDLASSPKLSGNDMGVYAKTLSMAENLRGIVSDINQSAKKLTASSETVSGMSLEVNTSASDQMKQLEQATTAMHEMTMTVDEVAKNAVQASSAMDRTNEDTLNGLDVVRKMNSSIETLVKNIEEVVAVTNRLDDETQSIGGILDVIDGVSEQTNLLALNAAIEAARAGEHGRGFAVVADEVRGLATQTKQSTKEIQEMIARLQSEAKHSVSLLKVVTNNARDTKSHSSTADKALSSIQESINDIKNMNGQIATAAEEQSYAAMEINKNINTINDLAKLTHEASQKNSSTANYLKEIAHLLRESVVIFKL
jgi:methyl-accepting chemotaxis protein